MSRRVLLPLLVVLVAFAARTWQLDAVPPGWSDDELSNIYVISQKFFQGNYAVYYTDATGLEAPYHILSGLMLRLLGFNALGIRLLSAFLGVLTVPLTYQMGRRLYNRQAGLIAAATLVVFAGFAAHVYQGGLYEMRTVVAMTVRSAVWILIALAAFYKLRRPLVTQ